MHPKIKEGDFFSSINAAIKRGGHVHYLKNALKDYEDYRKVFETKFTTKNPPNDIYVFRFSYLSKKPIWREIAVLGNQNFDDLAVVAIDSMGWVNDHMHCFSFPELDTANRKLYSLQYSFYAPGWEDDPHPTFKTDEIKINEINYKENPKLRFMFDFGDGHEFDVELKRIEKNQKSRKHFPVLVDQRGIAPEQYPNYE